MHFIQDKLVPIEKQYSKFKRRFSVEQYKEMKSTLEKTVEMQKTLGFGDPNQSVGVLNRGLEAAMGAQEANALFEAGYMHIEEPSAEVFPRFESKSGNLMKSSKSFSEQPKFAMAKLEAGISGISYSSGSHTHTASIPVIPMAHLELAARAKELAPNADFMLAYMPQWESAPNLDPALLIRVADVSIKSDNGIAYHWFMAGPAWGGDKELVEEHLVPKSK